MNNKLKIGLLLLVVALVAVPEVSANPGYFSALTTVYGNVGTSCSSCHTTAPSLNAYGTSFAAIATHISDPTGALNTIGAPDGVPTPTATETPTETATPTPTPVLDIIPPATTLSGVTENSSFNNSVTITLNATDNAGGSGVNETIYMVNGGATVTYSAPFVVDTIGQDNVSYWSTDNAGNVETTQIVNFTITSEGVTPSTNNLTSVKVETAPVIDGLVDSMWDQATPLMVNLSGGANAGSHVVTLKSVYTEDSVYFLATWNDLTESLRRMPWQKQADGTWKQLKTPDAKEGGENTYYEDKFSQIWNKNITGFETSGCSATCHAGENSDIKDYGNMYTANPGEIGDIWHMKIVRTNATGFVDDQYIDSTRYSNDTADAGRHSDPGLAPYYNNINENNTAPNFTSADQPAPPYWIFDDQKQPFNDTYNTSDEIAGIIVRSPTGDRADIMGKAVYMDGKWTLEYGRKLITGSEFDVQFSDMEKEYLFGTAVFDNAQTRHSYESGVSKFIFAPSANVTDTIPPTTTISGVTEDGSFNNSVTITLNATDNAGGSGVNETIYMVNGGPTTTYSAPFVVNTIGQDNVTYWSTDNAGNVEPRNMVNFTIIPEVNATATREIGGKSILPGESTNITVRIAGITKAIGLHEIPPQGWNVTRGSDNADGFKNNTNEWVWINSDANKTVTYTLTAPMNISIGTYQIEGTIRDVNGTLANVEGDNSIKIDILEVYRRLGDDPAVVETGDLLSAFDDFRNNRAPAPFDRPLNTEEVAELINEWITS
ncbi:MAG: ethylbenzene dehydrogenase-related protein [Candidatus Methanoperedens sp.]|nr:ethylbenzene dehydrogenase-related protein [Candidatus Methanoperedens sp.]